MDDGFRKQTDAGNLARILKAGPRPRNSILFLADDGEEQNLLGARLFADSPQAARVRAVVNLEARGASGPSLMFETGLAKVIGKSRSHLANTLRLLRLPETVQELIRVGQLSAGHARPLVGRADAEAIATRVVNLGLSVRQVEALTQDRSSKPKRAKSKDADTRAAEAELHQALGLAVEIKKGKGEKGELRIRYTTLDQLEDLRHRLLRRR